MKLNPNPEISVKLLDKMLAKKQARKKGI